MTSTTSRRRMGGSSNASTVSSNNSPDSSPPPAASPEMRENMEESGVSEAMRKEEEQLRLKHKAEEEERDQRMAEERKKFAELGSDVVDKKFKALEYLLSQSKLFSTIMLSQMQQDERADPEPSAPTPRGRGRPKKSAATDNKITSYLKKDGAAAKPADVKAAIKEAADSHVNTGDVGIQDLKSARQPKYVTGGTMRKYQLEGLEWLKSLYENGLNGILADEMGLGKTIQTISFLAFLREMGSYGPFLIVAPLSTTTNWILEFEKWTPEIPAVLYHGSKDERATIRRKMFKNPGSATFPVVVTSYEMCMNDRKFLANFGWKFIIIDEGHRVKNHNCKLIRELQQYQSANRLLITGTPLQNNLSELWSLLHFLMPEVFDKLESFESWFDFSELKDREGYEQLFTEERKKTLVASLHAILKPFLLRRVKTDVEKLLPKKREYVLFAPLTIMQRELYQAILDGTSREYLEEKLFERLSVGGASTPNGISGKRSSLKRKALDASGGNTPSKSARTSRDSTPASSVRATRNSRRKDYSEVSDRRFFSDLENSSDRIDSESTAPEDEEETISASTLALAKRQIANKKLQNPVMQLRLCCDSPYNFFNPFIQADMTLGDPDETLVTTSGKMLILDALLPALFRDGHKVLIFSQFKTQLDILESYASLRNWQCCRIDGSIAQTERAAQIATFNQPSSSKKTASLFLLSTRAGGQGINLAAADTVVLYDSDWNPQQDLQAQDRAHRIGQTRNVIVYRFATRGTVEQQLLDKAEGKRRLEKLVIRKGGLKDDATRNQSLDDLQQLLRRSDGEKWEVKEGKVLTQNDLKILLDRSEEAYERAERGMDESTAFKAVDSRAEGGLLESLQS